MPPLENLGHPEPIGYAGTTPTLQATGTGFIAWGGNARNRGPSGRSRGDCEERFAEDPEAATIPIYKRLGGLGEAPAENQSGVSTVKIRPLAHSAF